LAVDSVRVEMSAIRESVRWVAFQVAFEIVSEVLGAILPFDQREIWNNTSHGRGEERRALAIFVVAAEDRKDTEARPRLADKIVSRLHVVIVCLDLWFALGSHRSEPCRISVVQKLPQLGQIHRTLPSRLLPDPKRRKSRGEIRLVQPGEGGVKKHLIFWGHFPSPLI
jgi:hypothetical protein